MKNHYRSIKTSAISFLTLSIVISSSGLVAESKPSDTLRAASYNMKDQLNRCPSSPNCVNSLYKDDAKHFIKAIKTKDLQSTDNDTNNTDEAITQNRENLLEILNNIERVKVVQVSDNYIKAEFSSNVFSFVDDVEFLISSDKIDVKSASRTGYHDMGANRRRIEMIRKLFEQH